MTTDQRSTGLEALEQAHWAMLYHAYGPATDTPDHLRALLEGDEEAVGKAMDHLWSAVIHQGTPWTATGTVARVLVGFLSDERLDREESLRGGLLRFLAAVAEAPEQAADLGEEELRRMASLEIDELLETEDEALWEGGEATDSFHARAILGCMEVAPVLMEVLLDGLQAATPWARACAAMGAVTLARTEALADHVSAVEERLLALAESAEDADERSAHVMALGDLGYLPLEFLDDPSPAVRMCAALAPGLADDAAALDELLGAMEHHAGEVDHWFEETPPQFAWRPRFSVVARLVDQVAEFDRLVGAAVTVVGVSSSFCVDFDWGPLLAAAFPDGDGRVRTEAQRRFLAAMVDNEDLWDPTLGNAMRWFDEAGLPNDREACTGKLKP